MFKNTIISAADNSGAVLMRITQIYTKSVSPLGVRASVVMRQFDRAKKLQKKKKYACMLISGKQLTRRKSGVGVRFSENRGILFYNKDFDKLLGTRVSGPVARELRRRGLDASVLQKISANCIFI
jgi:ribosomal protein L14